MNYIKSEIYRVTHAKGIYLFTGICGALLLAMNLVLGYFRRFTEGFPYGTTEFAFSMMNTALQMVMILSLVMACIIFADEYKNKTIMNSIAFGYSRTTLFIGKFVTTLLLSVVALAVVLAIFIGSSYLLLENSGIGALYGLLRGFAACALILIGSELAALTFCFLLGTPAAATWTWLLLFAAVPMITSVLGMKFSFFAQLNKWLAYNLVGEMLMVTVTQEGEQVAEVGMGYEMIWMTQEGLTRCLLVGGITIAIFLVLGIVGLRRKEIK